MTRERMPGAARSRRWWRGAGAALVTMVAVLMLVAAPAGAIPPDPPPDPPGGGDLGCLKDVTGSLWADADAVPVEQGTIVHWSTQGAPAGCVVSYRVSGPGLYKTTRSGHEYVVPHGDASGYARYELRASANGRNKGLGSLLIRVTPRTTWAFGRTTVHIDYNWQVADFIRAIATPRTTVRLAPDLNMDLSHRDELLVAPGVHLFGGRTSTAPGARLLTTTKPAALFVIGRFDNSDGVRIDGIRLYGGNLGIGDEENSPIGIRVQSSVNVEIANSEIYGWSGIGVQVLDDRAARISLANPTAVWVHDNYIHHNRHWGREGYGVQTNGGAYTLIERNVFDYNRHAIEASNDDGIGYLAYHNLLLTGGGENVGIFGEALTYSHQFDVHGTSNGINCGHGPWGYYCGDAGEYFDYRFNALWYTNGDALKVRGEPDIGADVVRNVFSHGDPGNAIEQTDGDNLHRRDNRFGMWHLLREDACDFDGDGQSDDFVATGENWWFRGATAQFHFLNASRVWGPEQVAFEDADQDGRCDVRTEDGTVFRGGRAGWLVAGRTARTAHTDVVWQPASSTGNAVIWRLDAALQQVRGQVTVPAASDARMLATGDFNGDGATDLLWRNAAGFVSVSLLDGAGGVVDPIGGRSPEKGHMVTTATVAGVGDFNADGRSDVLWRHHTGELELWFAAEAGNSAPVTWLNDVGAAGEPVPAPVGMEWTVKGIGDFNGDGYSDILWHSIDGLVSIWHMHHAMHAPETEPAWQAGSGWQIHGVGDFDADGAADVLWRLPDGELRIWFRGESAGQATPSWRNIAGHRTGPEWQVQTVGDFSADGRADIMWRRDDGIVSIWTMDGGRYAGESALLPMSPAWQVRGLLAEAPQRADMQ